jgi:hypothetical protein
MKIFKAEEASFKAIYLIHTMESVNTVLQIYWEYKNLL